MLAGGALLLLAGVTLGEPAHLDLARVSTRSLLGFIYLVTFGSLIGFTAYLYLLAHTTAAKAATYAYVNPVVAVLLGWAIGHEPVTKRTLLAAAVILAGVAIITITRDAAPSVALSDAGETRLRERA
jgi:drug/metabolite transporter (DMT)-like permease